MVFNGKIDDAALKRERVSREEVFQAMRSSGVGVVESVEAVVLETNGNFSIIRKTDRSGTSTLPETAKDGAQ